VYADLLFIISFLCFVVCACVCDGCDGVWLFNRTIPFLITPVARARKVMSLFFFLYLKLCLSVFSHHCADLFNTM
jgi:hypothetical protein